MDITQVSRKLLSTAVVTLCLLGLVNAASAEASLPIDSVKLTVERIIHVLTDGTMQGIENTDKRREAILQLVNQRFNFQLMSRLALGENWDSRTDDERVVFVDLFSDLLKKNYIRRIESYSNEKVVFTKQDIKKNLAMVYSQFVKDNTEIAVIYKMKKDGDDWLIFDVVIEGASVIKQYRRQFLHIITEEQFEGLIHRLEEKVNTASAS